MKNPLLISACFLGIACRYDGKSKEYSFVQELAEKYTLIPICPEQLGGLKTPRFPAEIQAGKVCTIQGKDCTKEFIQGAVASVAIAKLTDAKVALMKSNSPSCGCGEVYDGTFQKKLLQGNGITSQAFLDEGIRVFTEKEIDTLVAFKLN